MSELKRYWLKAYEIDSDGSWTPFQRDYYLATDVDALLQSHAQELAERDRREGELRAENEQLKVQLNLVDNLALGTLARAGIATPAEGFEKAGWVWLQTAINELSGKRIAAESELATLRQQVREVTEWRPMADLPTPTEQIPILLCRSFDRWVVLVDSVGEVSGSNRWLRHSVTGLGAWIGDCAGWLPSPPLPKEDGRG